MQLHHREASGKEARGVAALSRSLPTVEEESGDGEEGAVTSGDGEEGPVMQAALTAALAGVTRDIEQLREAVGSSQAELEVSVWQQCSRVG